MSLKLIPKYQNEGKIKFDIDSYINEKLGLNGQGNQNDSIKKSNQPSTKRQAMMTEVKKINTEAARTGSRTRAAITVGKDGTEHLVQGEHVSPNKPSDINFKVNQTVEGFLQQLPGITNSAIGSLYEKLPTSLQGSWYDKFDLPSDVIYNPTTKTWSRKDGKPLNKSTNGLFYINGTTGRHYLKNDGSTSFETRPLKEQIFRDLSFASDEYNPSSFLDVYHNKKDYTFGNFDYSTIDVDKNLDSKKQVALRAEQSLNKNKKALMEYYGIPESEWEQVIKDTYGVLARETDFGRFGAGSLAGLNSGTKFYTDFKALVGNPSTGLGGVKINSDLFTDNERKDLGLEHYIQNPTDATSPEFSAVASAAAIRKERLNARKYLKDLNLSQEDKTALETILAQTAYNQGWNNILKNIEKFKLNNDKKELFQYKDFSANKLASNGYYYYNQTHN